MYITSGDAPAKTIIMNPISYHVHWNMKHIAQRTAKVGIIRPGFGLCNNNSHFISALTYRRSIWAMLANTANNADTMSIPGYQNCYTSITLFSNRHTNETQLSARQNNSKSSKNLVIEPDVYDSSTSIQEDAPHPSLTPCKSHET